MTDVNLQKSGYLSNGIRRSNDRGKSRTNTSNLVEKKIIRVGSLDYTMLFVVTILVLIGIVMVFSASFLTAARREAYGYDTFHFLKKQASFAVMGFCTMVIMTNFNYRYLRTAALPVYMIGNVLLIGVFLFGTATKGAKRFIYNVPVIGSFQPSEVAKVGVILMLAFLISKNKDILRKWAGFLFCCAVVGVTALLVMLGNLSTAIIVSVIGFGIIFVASPHIMRFVMVGAAGIGAMFSYLFVFSDMIAALTGKVNFRGGRVDAWLDPFSDQSGYGYQVIQSLYAIASGGMFGLGIGQSRQKSFIPEAHNDIIFSIICEELGFVGAAIVLLLFGILIWRGIKTAVNAPDTFSSLVATGIVILIASQVIINVAVVTNSIPNTGVPMPFISYGGTTLIVTLALMGVLLNISRCSKD